MGLAWQAIVGKSQIWAQEGDKFLIKEVLHLRRRDLDLLRMRPPLSSKTSRSLTALYALAVPGAVMAQLHALPFADLDYQYNSNVFALPRYEESSLQAGGVPFADHDKEERAGIQILYDLGIDQLYANVEARRFDYEALTSFDHNELLAHEGLKWQAAGLLDGAFDYEYERSMVPTLEFAGTQLYIQHEHLATLQANLQVTPYWRIESQGQLNNLDSPRPGFPSLSLTEDSIQERLRYVPTSEISTGVDFTYLKGHFDGNEFVLAPSYEQTTLVASAKYEVSSRSALNSSLGYTRRTLEGDSGIGAATGSFSYQRAIGAKTSVTLKLNRAVNTYVTFLGTEVDTSATVSASWKATVKFFVTGEYQWAYTKFPEEAVSEGPTERLDHYQLSNVALNYQALNWLALKLYGQYETRSSDLSIREFNRSFYGIGVEVRLSGQADQPYELSIPEL